MKTILSFRKKEEYGQKFDYVKVLYQYEQDCYVLEYKYVTMKDKCIKEYQSKELAMYDFNRKVMFLLS